MEDWEELLYVRIGDCWTCERFGLFWELFV